MLTVICSTEQIESMEYYLRSSGVADVFLRKNIQKQDTEDGGDNFAHVQDAFQHAGSVSDAVRRSTAYLE